MRKTKGVFFSLAVIMALFTWTGTEVAAAENRELIPMGCTVGIQVKTDGVMVVGVENQTDKGNSQSENSEIAVGDLITEVQGKKVHNAIDFEAVMSDYDGGSVSVKVIRDGNEINAKITPQMKDGMPVLGLWLRDGVEGIGTLTYYDPQTGIYGCLGHGIVDVDCGINMPVGDGSIFNSSIENVQKGQAGVPGELCGIFELEGVCGSVEKNTNSGIFGKLSADKIEERTPMPVADKDEIATGKATILANVAGTSVKEYEIEVTRIYRDENELGELMLRISDEELLNQTGGIVRGMSGSPIIQNGKIIGAVTHVLVNDPTRGYGISIEKMLDVCNYTDADVSAEAA